MDYKSHLAHGTERIYEHSFTTLVFNLLILGYILILVKKKKMDFCFAGFILFVFSLKKDYYKVQFSLVRKNTSNFYFVN